MTTVLSVTIERKTFKPVTISLNVEVADYIQFRLDYIRYLQPRYGANAFITFTFKENEKS